MKLKSKLGKLISGFTAAVMCFTMLPSVPTLTSDAAAGDRFSVGNGRNQYKGNSEGYSYEIWIDTTGGSGTMTLGSGATFKAEWSASVPSGNFLARRGLDFGSQKKATDYEYIGMDYAADYRQTGSASGNSRLCVYGWFENQGAAGNVPLVEYYIIEDWVDWCPDANGKMVTIDGAQYKIFQMDHTGPTIHGNTETFKQYFSVRQSKRKSGHITVSDHFKAWAQQGWGIGNLYEVALNAEGWQSSGVADITMLDVYTDPDKENPIPEPEPEPVPEPDENGHYINEKFESGEGDFVGRGAASVEATTSVSNSGSKSLAVSGRTDSWNGAAINLNTSVFKPGESYGFSVMAMQNDSASEDFKLTLQYTDSSGKEQYADVATATGGNGEWVQLANPSYKIPSDASNLILYVETVDSTTDFFIDDAILALENKISVSEPVGKYIRGDLNNDGRINIFDLVLERNAVINSFSGAANSPAADIDGDGKIAANDLVLLSQYIHGKITKFPTTSTTTTTRTTATTTTTVTTSNKDTSSGGSDYMDKIKSSITNNVPSNITANSNNGCKEEKISYYSTVAKKNKNAVVILPPNYSTSKKYPVVYVNHGIFGSENDMVGYCKSIGGNLMAAGEAEEMILVSCAMYTSQNSDQCSGFSAEECAKYDAFREDLIECLMPYMEEHYSIKTGRENTGICGFSMGGRESLYIGITRPEYFGYIGAACPAPGITPAQDSFMVHPGNMQPSEFKIQNHAYDPYLLMITGGTNDTVVGTFPKQYHEMLTNNNQPHIWQEIQGGGHDQGCVNPLMYNFLKYAFKA